MLSEGFKGPRSLRMPSKTLLDLKMSQKTSKGPQQAQEYPEVGKSPMMLRNPQEIPRDTRRSQKNS